MSEPMRARHTRPAWNRVAAAVLILAALLSSPSAGLRPAQAAPAAQAQNLCKLAPPGYDPTYAVDQADYCSVGYDAADGNTLFFELSRWYSPLDAYRHLPCDPGACASGQTCNSTFCNPYGKGDVAPAGIGHNYQGVSYATSSQGGYAYAWTRGCYLVVAYESGSTDKAIFELGALNSKADALIATGPCAGCNDPSVCQGTGTGGSTGGTGTSGTTPAGTFAVSRVSCWYDASVDAANCEAEVVNARPNAVLEYDWSLDGVAKGTIPGPQTLFAIGCAGEHTISVIVRDTENNLSSTSMSTKVTSTYGAPCTGGTGTGLTLAAPNCYYSKVEDRLTCVAQVVDAPAGADLLFEWSLDGTLLGETTESLDKWISPDGQAHTIQVTANDPASGKRSAPMSYTFQADAGAGSLQVQTASGTTSIGGSSGSSSASLALNQGELAAKVFADCPELGLVLLTDVRFDENLALVTSSEGSTLATKVVLALLILDCDRLRQKAEGPLQIAAVGDPALFLPAQATGDDLPVQLWIGHQGGPLRVNAGSDQVLLKVQTSVATVRSAGKNDFGVNSDAETGETTVAVYGGSVEVYSSNTGDQIAALGAGQQVAVAADGTSTAGSGGAGGAGPSVVGPYGEGSAQPQGTTVQASRRSSNTAALIGVPLAVILLCVAVAAVRRRGRAAGARPAAAAPADRPVTVPPVRPVALEQGRALLVVLQGAAQPPSLPLTGNLAVLGSDPSCTLVLHDTLVSAQHASLAWYGGAWVLSDASTNGTFVNGVRIKRQELRPGDVIQIGSVRLAFQVQA